MSRAYEHFDRGRGGLIGKGRHLKEYRWTEIIQLVRYPSSSVWASEEWTLKLI
jgi:hypothetical protein